MQFSAFLLLISMMARHGADDVPQPIDDSHLVIYGNVVEILYGSENEANAPLTQVVIYRDNEIFSAFRSNERGEYVFNLPVGYAYELDFGGSSFVNKRVIIDTRACSGKPANHTIAMDIALFRPVETMDYSAMQEPIVRWYFDKTSKEMVPDFNVVEAMMRTVDKLYRKSEKIALKGS
jgi:hypothetical protein